MTRLALRPIHGILRWAGYDVQTVGRHFLILKRAVPEWHTFRYIDEWIQPRHLAQLCRTLHVDCVVDIGANHGDFAWDVRQAGWMGRIVSVEPQTVLHATLRERFAGDPSWQLLPFALGDEDGEATLHLRHDSVMASLGDARAESAIADAMAPGMEIVGEETVPLRRLDGIFHEIAGAPVTRAFVKIDTQGHDTAVLRGATGVLSRIVALQTEMTEDPLYTDAVPWLEHARWLDEHGFGLNATFPVNRHAETQIAVEFDGVFVRRDASVP